MADNRAELILDGNVSPLKQKLREAGEALRKFGSDGESAVGRMTGPLSALQEKFVAVGAILAGGAVFKEAVAQAAAFTEENMKLGQALGISAGEASVLAEALLAGNTSQDDFLKAAKGLSKELVSNEADLQAMGLATRDAAGHLRPLNDLVFEGIKVVNGYRAGTDRAIAGQAMFGKGFEMNSQLARMNKDALAETAEQMQALGIVTSRESVAAFEAFDDAGDRAALTMKGVGITVGNVLMPVLSDLANWFSAIGPAAVTVIRGALGGLVSAFHFITTGVTVLWETINAMIVSVAEPIRALGESIGRAMSGDWSGAAESITNIGSVIKNAWSQAFDEMAAKAQSTRDRVSAIFGSGTPVGAPATGGKSATGLLKVDDKGDKSRMPQYEAELAEKKRIASEENALREYTKAEELAYWQQLQKGANVYAKDRIAIAKKVADLTVASRREEAKQQQAVDAEMVRSREAMALLEVESAKAAAQASLENGDMTKQQFLEMERQFERQRHEIQRAALEDRLRLLEADPNTNPVEFARIKNQILELDRQHQIRMINIQGQVVKESNQIWESLGQSMSSLWDKGVQALMNGTFTWRSAFKAVGAELVSWFATQVVGKQVTSWLAGQARMFAIRMGFLAQEQTAQAASSAVIVASKTTEAGSVIAANAAEAGAGAAASQASIPWVGPALALAAMATVFAAVSAMSGKVKSAARGYDIPKGLNPMVQTHEEEMILPKQYANVIRGLAAGSGESGGGGDKGGDVVFYGRGGDWVHKDDLAKMMRKLNRNFVTVKK